MPETASAPTPTPPKRAAWVRAAVDKVPTQWFAMIGTVAFLGATAAFGGLNDVPEKPIPAVEPGSAITLDEAVVSVADAFLVDRDRAVDLADDAPERVLVLEVDIESRWDQPTSASKVFSRPDVDDPDGALLRLPAFDFAGPDGIARSTPGTAMPVLQPNVPTTLRLAWVVEPDAFAAGDEIEIEIIGRELSNATLAGDGSEWYWTGDDVVGTVTVALTDRGARVIG